MGTSRSVGWGKFGLRCLAACALGLSMVSDLAQAATEATAKSPVQRILAHGPWPAPTLRDTSNRVLGHEAAIEFGYRMFREPRLSSNSYVSCVTCHQTDRAFTDGIARAHALGPLPRNTPTLANLQLQHWFGWDGASDSLWLASLRPMLDDREMGSDAARIAHVVRTGDGLACRYQNSFAARPARHADELVMVNAAKAIAAFVATMRTGRTRFDDYRDALLKGDRAAMQRFPLAAQRGLQIFVGSGGCASCHTGPNFSDGRFHANPALPARPGSELDLGRAGGIGLWRASAYNRLGRFSDDPRRLISAPTVAQPLPARFRTPSLRNVAVTPPYMHDGSVDSLKEAAAHSAAPLSRTQLDDVVGFLQTLTDTQGARRSFPPVAPSACN